MVDNIFTVECEIDMGETEDQEDSRQECLLDNVESQTDVDWTRVRFSLWKELLT